MSSERHSSSTISGNRDRENDVSDSSRTLMRYILKGFAWGSLIYVLLVSLIIYFTSGGISDSGSYSLLAGLLSCVPFIFCLGYIIDKIIIAKEESRLKSVEIEYQNIRMKKEIAERERKEVELLEAKKDALQGVKAKDQFLSNMSHEIRTPMNGVLGLANLLLESDLNSEQREYVASIGQSAKNLMVLINQILDLSKINSEKITLESIDFDIRACVRNIENSFKTTTTEKGIILRTLIDPQVPQHVCGDPVRFNQILLNLIGNAMKFTQEGGVDLIINSKETDDGPRLLVQVNDTGIGIPKDKLDSIFESFAQAGSDTTRMYGGTGLGLAISKELVQLYGGKLRVDSEVGKGSSFHFEMQLHPAKAQQEKEKLTQHTNERKLPHPQKIKILLAEDNRVNQLVAKATLRKRGFTDVTVAPNGQEVIEWIYKEHFDLILMDVQMPIMNGLDATRFIRNATEAPMSGIKIIAMTASAMREDVEQCLAVGMDDYISKPFNPEELFEKLYAHLECE